MIREFKYWYCQVTAKLILTFNYVSNQLLEIHKDEQPVITYFKFFSKWRCAKEGREMQVEIYL